MRLCVAVFLILFLLPSIAFAGQFEDGKTAWSHLDYDTTFKLLKPLANHGNAQAQYMVGVLYFSGEGVERNYAEARNWFRKAADQGDKLAQGKLGLMYDGYGVKQDYQEAYFWKLLAATSTVDPVWQYQAGLSARHLTQEQKAAVKKRVKEWKPTPAVATAPETQ